MTLGADVANCCPTSALQRVYFSSSVTGSSAEYTLCFPTHTFPLPPTLSFEEGACLGVPYLTAHRALFGRARAVAGHKVLVHGATGAVGIAVCQLALAAGMQVGRAACACVHVCMCACVVRRANLPPSLSAAGVGVLRLRRRCLPAARSRCGQRRQPP